MLLNSQAMFYPHEIRVALCIFFLLSHHSQRQRATQKFILKPTSLHICENKRKTRNSPLSTYLSKLQKTRKISVIFASQIISRVHHCFRISKNK